MTEPRGQGPNQEEASTVQGIQAAQAPQADGPAALELRAAKMTDVGQARPHNEDYVDYLIPSDPRLLAVKGSIFIVADGMGGHQAGEVASKGAVEATIAHYQADTGGHDVGTSLVRAFRAANQQLYAQAEGDPSKGGMGTTLVAAVVLGRKVYVANVGDSRAYLISSRGITQITEDHSWVEEQVRAGLLNVEQARRHPQRNLVTRALGSKPSVEVDLFEGEISAGDTILLCSDGLTGRVSDQEIAELVGEHPPSEAAAELVALANERGGNDNITVLIIAAEEATPTVKAPIAAAGRIRPARRSPVLPLAAALVALFLVGAVGAGILLGSGVVNLPFLQRATRMPDLTVILSPGIATQGTTQVVTTTGAITPTATLSLTGTASAGTGTSRPVFSTVTLISPTDGISLTGVVTFTWMFGPGTLEEDLAFQLVIGRGDPSDPGAQSIGPQDRRMERVVDLDDFLNGPGDYYWTVRVVEPGAGTVTMEAPARPFVFQGPATPGSEGG